MRRLGIKQPFLRRLGPYVTKEELESISTNRLELLKTRNQLHATRDRVESYRMKLVDSPLDSPASPLQLSVSAAS